MTRVKLILILCIVPCWVQAEKRDHCSVVQQQKDQKNITPQVILTNISNIVLSVLAMVGAPYNKINVVSASCNIIASIATMVQHLIKQGIFKGVGDQEIAALIYKRLIEQDVDHMMASYLAKTIYHKRLVIPSKKVPLKIQ